MPLLLGFLGRVFRSAGDHLVCFVLRLLGRVYRSAGYRIFCFLDFYILISRFSCCFPISGIIWFSGFHTTYVFLVSYDTGFIPPLSFIDIWRCIIFLHYIALFI